MGKTVDINLDEDAAVDQAAPAIIDEDAPVAARVRDADIVDEDVDPLDKLPAHAVTNADRSVTLPLKFPQDLQLRKNGAVRTDRFAQLIFHRLNGADQRAIAATSEETMSVVAFSRSTRLNMAVMNALFDRMDAADIAAGGQVLNSFLATGRKTGR